VSINDPASPEKLFIEPFPAAGPPRVGPALATVDPNKPDWGVIQAALVWIISVVLLFFVPLLAVIPYIVYKVALYGSAQDLGTDPTLIFISILGVLPAHLLTFLTVWLVVTKNGNRPFWSTVGWSWPKDFGPWKTIGLAVVLLIIGGLITWSFGGSETQLDQIINSSLKARFVIAFMAAVTGPFVEELIYRGVLYSALQKVLGMTGAVVIVSILFAGVHVLQYYKNLAVIAAITILSVSLTVVRARSGRLLPSYVIHLVFNGIQAVILVLQPFLEKSPVEKKAAIGLITHSLSRLLT